MKVAPGSRDIANTAVKVPVSKFVKFIRLMSNCYILPLRYSGDFSEVTFSILHWKTLVNTALVSIPLLLTVIWLGIVQWGFIPLYIEKSLKVYTTFDFIITMIVVVNQINTITISRWSAFVYDYEYIYNYFFIASPCWPATFGPHYLKFLQTDP